LITIFIFFSATFVNPANKDTLYLFPAAADLKKKVAGFLQYSVQQLQSKAQV